MDKDYSVLVLFLDSSACNIFKHLLRLQLFPLFFYFISLLEDPLVCWHESLVTSCDEDP